MSCQTQESSESEAPLACTYMYLHHHGNTLGINNMYQFSTSPDKSWFRQKVHITQEDTRRISSIVLTSPPAISWLIELTRWLLHWSQCTRRCWGPAGCGTRARRRTKSTRCGCSGACSGGRGRAGTWTAAWPPPCPRSWQHRHGATVKVDDDDDAGDTVEWAKINTSNTVHTWYSVWRHFHGISILLYLRQEIITILVYATVVFIGACTSTWYGAQ